MCAIMHKLDHRVYLARNACVKKPEERHVCSGPKAMTVNSVDISIGFIYPGHLLIALRQNLMPYQAP